MSVFTTVDASDLRRWLDACGAGSLVEYVGVEGGVENTNYRVDTTLGAFVLTLFEWMPREAAERSLAFTAALADLGLPVAAPWPQMTVGSDPKQRLGSDPTVIWRWTAMLAGKPAALVRWLTGTHPETPTLAQCAAIGDFLGCLHTTFPNVGAGSSHNVGAVQRTAILLPDSRGPIWRAVTAARVTPKLNTQDRELLEAALADVSELPELPEGAIHADLFRDNALFEGDTLCGVIDFHYACRGSFAYDLAVAALDWCADDASAKALKDGYANHRALSEAETAQWARLKRMAALRFWLSRLHDMHFPRPGGAVLIKDPEEMRDRLRVVMV